MTHFEDGPSTSLFLQISALGPCGRRLTATAKLADLLAQAWAGERVIDPRIAFGLQAFCNRIYAVAFTGSSKLKSAFQKKRSLYHGYRSLTVR